VNINEVHDRSTRRYFGSSFAVDDISDVVMIGYIFLFYIFFWLAVVLIQLWVCDLCRYNYGFAVEILRFQLRHQPVEYGVFIVVDVYLIY